MFRIADCMKTLMNKILVIAVLGMGLVACSKEEVKPFTAPCGSSAGNLTTKSLSGDGVNDDTNADQQQGTTSDEETGVTSDNTGEGSGITDGGTSSDYDSKGTKRKPGKN